MKKFRIKQTVNDYYIQRRFWLFFWEDIGFGYGTLEWSRTRLKELNEQDAFKTKYYYE